MGDAIFFGVLRMPPELWRDDELDKRQRHARYVQAADEIEALRAECERLREKVEQIMGLAAELYQVLGALDADDKVLDQVSAAAHGNPLPHDTLLPFTSDEHERLRADARRYQWLRDQELPDVMDLWHQHPARVDDAIDTAMEATNAG